ncbi:hypothetical protein [Sphingomonas jatrophae]|uniref:Uncharacterized protein n=1 Tax=Sphingomonas jatrophae TaxID=1166337 RepID=A0A1I6JS08_9SPHN|nr:hypothetical protein [Sphingomonas jatrophae]SFR81310.1 hypothetical protein SAMN05192580_0689 [Sphingomonas jatrophae]
MTPRILSLSALLLVSACATTPRPAAPVASTPAPALPARGLEGVLGRDARALTALFGDPDQDVREPGARKLQFAGAACVLDAYLYTPANGREAVVKWVDARTPKGDDFDRASCVAALSRRSEAR